jgi:hypothetical protein
MQSYYDNKLFHDTIIHLVDGNEIYAHKVVLASNSRFFATTITQSIIPRILCDQHAAHVIRGAIRFMYGIDDMFGEYLPEDWCELMRFAYNIECDALIKAAIADIPAGATLMTLANLAVELDEDGPFVEYLRAATDRSSAYHPARIQEIVGLPHDHYKLVLKHSAIFSTITLLEIVCAQQGIARSTGD